MSKHLNVRVLNHATKYLDQLTAKDRGPIAEEMEAMRSTHGMSPYTKQLRGPVRELVIGDHRLLYFKIDSNLYFVSGFRKKTQKTPRSEIEYAEKMYKLLR